MKLHQINEDDLATLERELPLIVDRLYATMDNVLRAKIRQIQRIIGDVRWNYGPPRQVETFPADGPLPKPDDIEGGHDGRSG